MTVKLPSPSSQNKPFADQVRSSEPNGVEDRFQRLTPRQKDCLRLTRPDFSSKLIGKELGVSARSVDSHIRSAMRVAGLTSRFEAGQRFRAWESKLLQAANETVGDQSVGVPGDHLSPSNGAVDKPSNDGPPTGQGVRAETGHGSEGRHLQEPVKRMSEANDTRRPPLVALAISIIAILVAIGAIAALLFILDWANQS